MKAHLRLLPGSDAVDIECGNLGGEDDLVAVGHEVGEWLAGLDHAARAGHPQVLHDPRDGARTSMRVSTSAATVSFSRKSARRLRASASSRAASSRELLPQLLRSGSAPPPAAWRAWLPRRAPDQSVAFVLCFLALQGEELCSWRAIPWRPAALPRSVRSRGFPANWPYRRLLLPRAAGGAVRAAARAGSPACAPGCPRLPPLEELATLVGAGPRPPRRAGGELSSSGKTDRRAAVPLGGEAPPPVPVPYPAGWRSMSTLARAWIGSSGTGPPGPPSPVRPP